MNLKLLKIERFFHLISKKDYNEKRQIEIVKNSPLFDAKWYLSQNPDVKAKKIGAVKHYVKYGWKEGRNPSADFDNDAYLREYPELRAKGWCPVFHYMLEHKELMPKVSYRDEILKRVDKAKLKLADKCAKKGIKLKFLNKYEGKSKDYVLIAKSKYFDKKWYLKQYPDVKKAKVDPVEHYLKHGWKEGRNPSKKFKSNVYLEANPDVKRANVNPLLHYLKYGMKEGRKVLSFDINKNIKFKDGTFYISRFWGINKVCNVSFSCILPTYNRAFCIENMIDSVLAQTYKNFELIIVDDGSTDNTEQLIRDKYAKELQNSKIVYKKLKNNKGVCFARNQGLKIAKNEWVCYVDSDNYIKETFLESYCYFILSNPSVKTFYSQVYHINSKKIVGHSFNYEKLRLGNYIDMGTFVHSRDLYLKCGGFDTNLTRMVDWDLILTYTKKHKPVFIPQAFVLYNDSNDIKRISNSENHDKNREMIIAKHSGKDVIKMKRVKILVHLHLYYHDQLDYFIKKLKNITCDYDLYVTMVDLDKEVTSKLKQFKPDVNIVKVANRGYDVYPFWQILQKINLREYFAVLKVHTKNCRDVVWVKDEISYIGYDWRNDLIEPLIGNKLLFRNCIRKLQRWNYGMVYSKNLKRIVVNTTLQKITKNLCDLFGYEYQQAPFACGTMFLIKSNCLIDFKNYKFSENDFSSISNTGCTTTLAHGIETFFGIMVVNEGLYSVGVHSVKTKMKDLKRKLAKLFKKRPKKYARDIIYISKSNFFDKKWYLKHYPDVKKANVDPVEHYMKHGWKEGRNPSKRFNTNEYLNRNKDVKNAKMNPLLHYEKFGKYEGRLAVGNCGKPSNVFLYPMWLKKQVSLIGVKNIKNDLPIIVSLTTYPARIYAVIETINSIFRQTLRPDKIILWLTYEEFPKQEKELPRELLELKKNGLIIGWCHNLRSYNKLLPSLKKYPKALHVTVDDDIIYKPTLIEKLYESYLKYPKDIQCHRITKFYYNHGYKTSVGGREYYENGSFLNKLTGVGGVLYPVGCFYKDIFDVDLIKKLAPTNDDQWFWFQSVLNGVKTRVVDDADPTLDYVDGSQETGLYLENDNGANLFWRDFKCLMEYYPQVDRIFKKELRMRKYEKIFNVVKSYVLLPYNYLFILSYKGKQKKLPVKNYKYYSELFPDLYPIELKEWYKKMTGYELNLDNPKTFNEKIQWLKLYDSTPKKTKLADKYLVRKWVKSQIGEKYLIPLLGVYDKFEDIDFDKLPDRFVIKCNHGSGWNIIVKDKSKLDLVDVKNKLDTWMQRNFAFMAGLELHYRDMQPKIIIEKFMDDGTGDLRDYKYTCFNGKPEFIWIDSDRHSVHKRNLYDLNWKQLDCKVNSKYDTFPSPEKPDCLKEMNRLAAILSKGFPYVRVDFYIINNKVYFGEMTFTSSSGIEDIQPFSFEAYLSEKLILPNKIYNLSTKQYEILKKSKRKGK